MDFSSLYLNISPQKKSHIPNVISIKPDRLVTAATAETTTTTITSTVTGASSSQSGVKNKLVYCKTCQAVLTCESQVFHVDKNNNNNNNENKFVWECEFCGFENQLVEAPATNELPGNDVNILLNNNDADSSRQDAGYFIFCVDVSKSMSEKSDIPIDEVMRRNVQLSPFDVFENRQGRISKFRSVEMAISDCINRLEKNAPNKRVGLVAFSKNVEVIGDGRMDKIVIDGADLESVASIESAARRTPQFEVIQNNKSNLIDALDKLKKHKTTSLGPALYYSVLMASRSKGSQVLLCTDGHANKGLGALDKKSKARNFYNEIANLAVANGVSVSIVTLEGSKCNLSMLIDVVCQTKGYVRIVKPFKLRDEFYSVMEKKILATNAKVAVILPRQMNFKSYSDPVSGQYRVEKEIGNVTEDTEVRFEVQVRQQFFPMVEKIPVQMQLYYDSLDGAKHMHLIVRHVKVTCDDELFEENMDRTIVASYLINMQTDCLSAMRTTEELDPVISTLYSKRSNLLDNFSSEEFDQAQSSIRNLQKELSDTTVWKRNNTKPRNNSTVNNTFHTFFPSPSPSTGETFVDNNSNTIEIQDSAVAELQKLRNINSRDLQRRKSERNSQKKTL